MAEIGPYGKPEDWVDPTRVDLFEALGQDPVQVAERAAIAMGERAGDVAEQLPDGETKPADPETLKGDGPLLFGE